MSINVSVYSPPVIIQGPVGIQLEENGTEICFVLQSVDLTYPQNGINIKLFNTEMGCIYVLFRQLQLLLLSLLQSTSMYKTLSKRGKACQLSGFDSVVGPCLYGSMSYYLMMCQISKPPHVLHRTQMRIFHLDQKMGPSELHHRNQ